MSEFPTPRAGSLSRQQLWEQSLKDRRRIKELEKAINRIATASSAGGTMKTQELEGAIMDAFRLVPLIKR